MLDGHLTPDYTKSLYTALLIIPFNQTWDPLKYLGIKHAVWTRPLNSNNMTLPLSKASKRM